MTEKRFIIAIDSNDRKSIWDENRNEEEPLISLNRFGEIWGIDDCCKLLNSLNDEKEQLKQREETLLDEIEDFQELLTKLDKENEQLKQKVNSLMEDLGYIDAELEELEDIDRNVVE